MTEVIRVLFAKNFQFSFIKINNSILIPIDLVRREGIEPPLRA